MEGCGAPAENRTPDTLIKSQVLYQLSYRGKLLGDTLIKSQERLFFGVFCNTLKYNIIFAAICQYILKHFLFF